MAYFSIGLEMAVTIYIQAKSLTEAQGKLARVVSKSIDAHDARWFSDASFGSPNLPEISFSTGMELRGPVAGEVLQVIDGSEVRRLMLSSPEAKKSKVVPGSKNWFGNCVTPIFWADLRAKATGIIKFETESQAWALLANMQAVTPPVHWECSDHWFDLKGLEYEKYPLILSPNIQILAEFDEVPLSLRWSGEEDVEDFDNGESTHRTEEMLPPPPNVPDLNVVSARLKTHLDSLEDGSSAFTDADIQEIAAFLISNREFLISLQKPS